MNTLHIINLPHRTDRLEEVMVQLKTQNITDYKIWDGIANKKYPKLGCLQAHKQIIKYAKENKLPYIHIAEDDIKFFDVGAWDFYLSKLPNDADMFWGMIYGGEYDTKGNITDACCAMTLYTCYEKFYDFILEIPDGKAGVHIDRYITERHKEFNLKVCLPFVCTQSGSLSDMTRTKCDYTPFFDGRDIYKVLNKKAAYSANING